MRVIIKDAGERENNIAPLEITLETNEIQDENDGEWNKLFADAFLKFCEEWWDFHGKINMEVKNE